MSRTTLFLHTDMPTRGVLARHRPNGRLVLASDWLTPADAAVYDELVELPSPHDVEATLARLMTVDADDVVVQTEYGLLAGALFARRRGLRGPSVEAALLTTNKWLCREALHAARVPVPRHALVENEAQVRRFADGAPVVIKSVASTLGHIVRKIEPGDDVEAAVARMRAGLVVSPHVRRCTEFARLAGLDMDCDATRQFLVEEFVDGPPLETDGLVFGERVDLFGATEQFVTPPPHFYIEGYLFPVPRPGLETVSRAAVRALRLVDCGFSIEFRGEVVIEVNGRLGEDAGFPELFAAGLGRFPILKWIERDDSPSLRNTGGSAIAYRNWFKDGTVRTVPTGDSTFGATVLVEPGERMFAPPSPDVAPHLAYALVSHEGGAHAAYREARAIVDGLRFEIDES